MNIFLVNNTRLQCGIYRMLKTNIFPSSPSENNIFHPLPTSQQFFLNYLFCQHSSPFNVNFLIIFLILPFPFTLSPFSHPPFAYYFPQVTSAGNIPPLTIQKIRPWMDKSRRLHKELSS